MQIIVRIKSVISLITRQTYLLLIASSVRLLLAPIGRSHSGCRQLLLAIPPGRSVPESAAPRTDLVDLTTRSV